MVVLLSAGVPPAAHPTAASYHGSVDLMASEVLIMTGTAMPDVTPGYVADVTANFINPTVGDGYRVRPVVTPAQFWPFTGLDSLRLDTSTEVGCAILDATLNEIMALNDALGTLEQRLAVYGYSQSSYIASVEKQILNERFGAGEQLPPIDFVLTANPVRPNGGLFSRIPDLGLITWNPLLSTPTDTPFETVDIARQYDFFADFPTYTDNVLAVVNSVFGLVNHDYSSVSLDPASPDYDPETVVQQYGDTTYYLIPSEGLPILLPLRLLGMTAVAAAIEPALRILIELGYDRTRSYGEAVSAQRGPVIDKAALKLELAIAVDEGRAILEHRIAGPAAATPVAPDPADPYVAVESQPTERPHAGGQRRIDGTHMRRSGTRAFSAVAESAKAGSATAARLPSVAPERGVTSPRQRSRVR
jgi:hypothetical protein